jgi:endo-1,4-beta-xylanase
MANYTVSTTLSGGSNVQYSNDADGRDVQVDYITVNGTTRQAENQTTNKSIYQNSKCNRSNSEWLHCNGCIGFGDV